MRTDTSMPYNVLGSFAPCSSVDLSTYWPKNSSIDACWSDPSAEPYLSIPVNFGMSSPTSPSPNSGAIAGSVLPLRRAEELISTLPGVLAVRIVPSDMGAIDEIHVLTTSEVVPKNTVRNIESALMAQLGLRVNHRKISIAPSLDPIRAADMPQAPYSTPHAPPAPILGAMAGSIPGVASAAYVPAQPYKTPPPLAESPTAPSVTDQAVPRTSDMVGFASAPVRAADTLTVGRRVLIFEDVEVRRSRTRGVLCRVTLGKSGQEYIGEAEGQESERSRIELAARATVLAIIESMKATPGGDRTLALEGSKLIEAFDREFIFVSVVARIGRESVVLTGSSEVRESPETSAVLAVLDATNRWMHLDR